MSKLGFLFYSKIKKKDRILVRRITFVKDNSFNLDCNKLPNLYPEDNLTMAQ